MSVAASRLLCLVYLVVYDIALFLLIAKAKVIAIAIMTSAKTAKDGNSGMNGGGVGVGVCDGVGVGVGDAAVPASDITETVPGPLSATNTLLVLGS